MTQPDRLSLEQLEDRAGVPSRQIRELIQLGILPAPSSRGRGATYGTEHVIRLRAWKRLRVEAPRLTNEQLKGLLNRLHDAGMLRGIAEGSVPLAMVDEGGGSGGPWDAVDPSAVTGAMHSVSLDMPSPARKVNEAAIDYLRAMHVAPPASAPARLAMSARTLAPTIEVDLRSAERSGAGVALERLRAALEAYVAQSATGVRVNPSKSESWHRIGVGRDLEIAARGPLTVDEIQLLETIGQLLQQALYRKES